MDGSVVNRGLDLIRRGGRLVGDEQPDRVEGEWGDLAEGDRALLEAVAAMGPQRRVVIVLRYGLGYPPSEIAEMLAVPVGTVHSRLARALDELRGGQLEEAEVERA